MTPDVMATGAAADLVGRAAEVAAVARGGAAWLEANRARLTEDPSGLARDFRKFARRAHRLQVAAARPMCVAVFGASQAGKSYLVSSLATRPGQALVARYGGQRLNFLTDLNPQGGKESTGLVSRFTLRPVAAPEGAPVPVRLMSQTDVVKILANAFSEDFKVRDMRLPDGAAVTALFDRLARDAGPVASGGMTVDDVEDLREYFEQELSPSELLRGLGPAYWARAVDIIPRLPPERRAEAYAPLWNGTAAFTRVAQQLTAALAQLGFPETAFCGLDALMPRETSVLDADMVFGLGEGSRGPVRLVAPGGMAATLDRSVVAALIAEITVPLEEKPWDFFAHTDLLDFPGARTREEITDPEGFLAQAGRLGRVFLRGKVAFLFQRYNAEQEITAMLLCVGPSNQDVQTLPNMIDRWIGQTVGATPEARAAQRNPLFLVLTKFDGEFEDKAGEDVGSGQRWTARIQASLLDFFGKAHAWPRQWTPGRAFDNTFWLRSTAIGFAAVMDYDAEGRELGVSPRAAAAVEARRQAYLANDLVRAHLADPARAWAAALAPGDGGIQDLAAALQGVCDPRTKADQVAGRVHELAKAMAQRLRPYHHTGDLAAELLRARREARGVARALLACAQAQMFGPLLRQMQVTSDTVASVYWDLQSRADDAPVPIGTVGSSRDYRSALGGLLDDDEEGREDVAPAAAPQVRDRFDRFADAALAEWNRQLQALADDPATPAAFYLPREQAASLVNEVMTAARRVGLRDRIADDLRARASFQHRAAAAQKPIMLVEAAINGFVHMLDFGRVPLASRPRPPNSDRPVFSPRAPLQGPPVLEEVPSAYDYTFHVDWIVAASRVFEDNVQDPAASGLDIPANDALGALLRRLDAA